MSLLSSFKNIATISSTSLCLSIAATSIFKSSAEAQVVNANYFTYQLSTNLVSNQSNKNTIWLTSNNNNLQAERFASNSPSETQKSHILLFGLVVLGSGVIAWEVRFRFFRVTLIQALERIYYRLPHYQNQLRIKKLEAQLSLLENNNFQAQLQQQLEEQLKRLFTNHLEEIQQQLEDSENEWRAQYSTELQKLQNQIQHLEGEPSRLQIEECVNHLLANHSEVVQQQLENCQISWRAQYSTELQKIQNQIQHLEGEFNDLQIEERVNNLLANHSEDLQQQLEKRDSNLFVNHSNILQEQIEEQVYSFLANHSENVQQQLENYRTSWQAQYSNELQKLQNQIEHIENKPVVLQSEWRNTKEVLEKFQLERAIETIDEKQEMVIDAFSDLEAEVRKVEAKVCETSSDQTSTLILKLQQAEETIVSLKKEIDDHQNNITELSRHYQRPKTTSEAEGSVETELNTVLDVLLKAEQEYSILEIFKSAKTSAQQASYRNYQRLDSALKAVAEIGEQYFQSQRESTSMGNRLEAEFRKKGFANNYRLTESKTTKNKYGDKREFCHSDRCVQIFRHLTFKNNNCSLQIYFEFDREQEKVIIGYCGNHLPIVSRPT